MTAFVFAILVGLGGAFVVRNMMKQEEEIADDYVPPPRQRLIATAGYDLEPGYQMTLGDIVPLTFTSEQLAKSPYAGIPDAMSDTSQIAGRRLRVPLRKGDPIRLSDLFPSNSSAGIAHSLPPGYRAITISAAQGAEFVSPGSTVDVLFRSLPEATRPAVTLTLLEAVGVLAVGNRTLPAQTPDAQPQSSTVTLACTPNQAKALQVVQGRGELLLTLRGPEDNLTSTLLGVNADDRLTLEQILNIAPPRRPQEIEVFRGGNKTLIAFPNERDPNFVGGVVTPIAADDR